MFCLATGYTSPVCRRQEIGLSTPYVQQIGQSVANDQNQSVANDQSRHSTHGCGM